MYKKAMETFVKKYALGKVLLMEIDDFEIRKYANF